MSTEDLRDVIERPALLPDVRLVFDEDLVGDLLFDIHGQIGALPLLEFALDQLFHHRHTRRLTRRAYQEIGGVRGSLSNQAESTYNALPSEEHRRLARTLFMRLVQPGVQGQEPLRRRADSSEFVLDNAEHMHSLHEVIDSFIDARLITVNQLHEISTLEISHEALIREWQRLAQWLQEAREDIGLQQIISNDILEWEHRGKPKDRLYRGSQLKESLAWQERNIASGKEAAFLRTSTTRRTRGYINLSLVALLLLALLISTGILVQQALTPHFVTTLKDDAPGSLRQVVAGAPLGSTIIIDPHLKGTMTLNRSLEINKFLTIRGPGVKQLALRGARGQNYLLHVTPYVVVTISQLTFSDPTPAPGPVIDNEGNLTLDTCNIIGNTQLGTNVPTGNVGFGGGIANIHGTLTLQNSIISSNTVISGNSFGGGIYSTGGALTIKNSQIVDNTVIGNDQATGGSHISDGAGIFSEKSTITLINSTVARNKVLGGQKTEVEGGGIMSSNDTITLTSSAITMNSVEGKKGSLPGAGGGISSSGSSININNGSQISNNTVTSQNTATGGAISSFHSKITINNSTLSNNSVMGTNLVAGGSISSTNGNLTITNATIAHNMLKSLQNSAVGAGIYDGDTLTITDSTVSDNSANASTTDKYGALGGGIDTRGLLNLSKTTISTNTANNSKGGAAGGGIFAAKPLIANAQLNLTNCTLANNKALGLNGGGGGFATYGIQRSSMDFCTIDGNSASTQGGGLLADWITTPTTPDLFIKNSIVAHNSAGTAPDISGTIITGGYNLLQHFTGATINDPTQKHKTDISGDRFANLGINTQLQNNGGPTPTLALQTNSPTIKAIPATSCDVTTDQRGVTRPQHNTCDIGAYQSS